MSELKNKFSVGGNEELKWLELVIQQVGSLRYGVVEIVVHDFRPGCPPTTRHHQSGSRHGVEMPNTNSTLDHVQFDGINLDTVFPQSFHGGGDGFRFAGEFQRNEANLVVDVGTADVEDEVIFFAQLPNQRALGALRREGEPVALGLLGHNGFMLRELPG